jgi:FkbM family methyltransferase
VSPQASSAEVERAYDQAVPFSIRLCRDWFGLKKLEFMPRDTSPLKIPFNSDDFEPTVKLVADYLMCPIVLGRHYWQIEELEFAKRACTGTEPITLVDIGANMGLFSRQLLNAIPAIATVFAYEPEPQNFDCLVHNLAPFRGKATLAQNAVSDTAGTMEFYLDPTNSGNFSLVVGAMPPGYAKTTVETKNVALECTAWREAKRRIFYKSDTEGLDELVASLIRPDVWQHIFAGLIEVWNIKKPAYDQALFASVLNQFPNKVFLANADNRVSEVRVSTADVLNYIASGNQQHRDLAFWR